MNEKLQFFVCEFHVNKIVWLSPPSPSKCGKLDSVVAGGGGFSIKIPSYLTYLLCLHFFTVGIASIFSHLQTLPNLMLYFETFHPCIADRT